MHSHKRPIVILAVLATLTKYTGTLILQASMGKRLIDDILAILMQYCLQYISLQEAYLVSGALFFVSMGSILAIAIIFLKKGEFYSGGACVKASTYVMLGSVSTQTLFLFVILTYSPSVHDSAEPNTRVLSMLLVFILFLYMLFTSISIASYDWRIGLIIFLFWILSIMLSHAISILLECVGIGILMALIDWGPRETLGDVVEELGIEEESFI